MSMDSVTGLFARIAIPSRLRRKPVRALPMSVRLRHVLEAMGIEFLGDIEGLRKWDFLKAKNCGKKTFRELMSLVLAIQRGSLSPPEIDYDPALSEVFRIREGAKTINFSDLPLSARLNRTVQTMGLVQLGQLDGLNVWQVLKIKDCGKKTINELSDIVRRAANGEFEASQTTDPHEICRLLIEEIDSAIQKLPLRSQRILLNRLGGYGDEPLTLKQVGAGCGITSERVRQILVQVHPRIRKTSGPKMLHWLNQITGFCHEMGCPLTPATLSLWLGDETSKCRFPADFYVRLLGELNPVRPARPNGHEHHGGVRRGMIPARRKTKSSKRETSK